MRYNLEGSAGQWSFHYNHLYYWEYDAPTGTSVDGNHIASLGARWSPGGHWSGLSIDLVIKNLWNDDQRYPINGTGNLAGADGTPALEENTWWFGVGYRF